VGILSAESAEYGVTGPVLRAAGVKWDLRKAQPYSGYEQYDFDIPTRTSGDTYDRYVVRMENAAIDSDYSSSGGQDSEGPIMGRFRSWKPPPPAKAYVSIEVKGELSYFIISDNSTQPYRMRVRPPSFVNLQALDRMVRGDGGGCSRDHRNADIVLGEVDR
jgi:NADH-quinone oxidoreductase subunit D